MDHVINTMGSIRKNMISQVNGVLDAEEIDTASQSAGFMNDSRGMIDIIYGMDKASFCNYMCLHFARRYIWYAVTKSSFGMYDESRIRPDN